MQNLNHLVSLLQEGYTTVAVVFQKVDDVDIAPWGAGQSQQPQMPRNPGVQYTYKCPLDIGVVKGDLVILPPSSAGKLPSIGTVVEVHGEPELNFESGIEYKWLIGKVDFTMYQDTLVKEQQIMSILRETERKKQRAALLEHYQLALPDDAEGRKIFDQARQIGLPAAKG